MEQIAQLIDEFNYIAMDTEFPGSVYVPPNSDNEFEYQMIKGNCDNLKLIQVGISLSNEQGEHPKGKTLAY
jgi:CCR4-NOT transcription complex subunit 7/8